MKKDEKMEIIDKFTMICNQLECTKSLIHVLSLGMQHTETDKIVVSESLLAAEQNITTIVEELGEAIQVLIEKAE